MHVTTHAIVGAALGGLSGSPKVAVVAGLVSHVALDVIPHYDAGPLSVAIVDGLIALGIAGFFVLARKYNAFWGAVGAAAPDLEVATSRLGITKIPRLFPTHSGLLPHGQAGPMSGTLIQLLFIGLAVYVIYHNSRSAVST